MNALTPEQEAVAKGFERLSKISEHLPELIQLLRDVADVGHNVDPSLWAGNPPDCGSDCTGCRAIELIEKLGLPKNEPQP